MSTGMPTKISLKEEIMEEVTEKLMKKILDMFKQKVQDHSRNFKTPQIRNFEKTQKQLNELREDFNKHQSETKDTIKKKRYMK
jgi:hypothetical protein